MRVARKQFLIVLTTFCVLQLACVKSTDNDSIDWRVNYSFPLIHQKFQMRDILGLNASLKSFFEEDSSRLGDTLHCALTDTISTSFTHTAYTITPFNDSIKAGVLRLTNIPLLHYSIPLVPVPVFDSFIVKLPEYRQTLPIEQIDHVTFDSTSQPLTITLINKTDHLHLKDLYCYIVSGTDTLEILQKIDQLNPMSTATSYGAIAGKRLGNLVTAVVKIGEISGTLDISDSVGVTIDVNGIAISEAVGQAQSFTWNFEYPLKIPAAEKYFNLEYLDIKNINIPIQITNRTPAAFEIEPVVDDVWDISYCKRNSIQSYEQLCQTINDSSYFLGKTVQRILIPGGTSGGAAASYTSTDINVSDIRLFSRWDNVDSVSKISLSVKCHVMVPNQIVSVNTESMVAVQTALPEICFDRIKGHYVIPKLMPGKLQHFKVPPFLTESIKDALRTRFRFIKSNLDLAITMPLKDSTSIDEIENTCLLFYHFQDKTETDSVQFTLDTVRGNYQSRHNFDMVNLINTFPDSVDYVVNSVFPVNTPLVFDSGTIDCGQLAVTIILPSDITMKLLLGMVWEVEDTVRYAATTPPIDFREIQKTLDILKDKSLVFRYSLMNQSAFVCKIFAFGAPRQQRGILDSITITQMETMGGALGSGPIIPLLGKNGISFAPRGVISDDSIALSKEQIATISTADSFVIRWGFVLEPNSADALHDTDNVEINSILSINGIQSTDNLPFTSK